MVVDTTALLCSALLVGGSVRLVRAEEDDGSQGGRRLRGWGGGGVVWYGMVWYGMWFAGWEFGCDSQGPRTGLVRVHGAVDTACGRWTSGQARDAGGLKF